MSNIQNKIDLMYSGDTEEIVSNVNSDIPILVANAIIAGTKKCLKNSVFLDAIQNKVTNSDITFFGMPLSDIAIASLDILGINKYKGNDDNILKLIHSGFNF